MVGENCPVRDLREGCHDVIETDLLFTNNCLLATSFPAPRAKHCDSKEQQRHTGFV